MNPKDLVSRSVYVLQEAKSAFKNPVILWSTGKASTSTLSLCREAFSGKVPFKVMHIDTGWKFKEVYKFRDMIAKDWDLDLVIEKSESAGKIRPPEISQQECCQTLRKDALKSALEKHEFDAVIVSTLRDRPPLRNARSAESQRDINFLPRFGPQRYFGADFRPIIVRPILHWKEIEVWEYIRKKEIPVNPMYFAVDGARYRSVGCVDCTNPIKSSATNVDEIIAELEPTKKGVERKGKPLDKDAEQVMKKLKEMGYM
jgi:sulfate adenylyltransferase subunit 2